MGTTPKRTVARLQHTLFFIHSLFAFAYGIYLPEPTNSPLISRADSQPPSDFVTTMYGFLGPAPQQAAFKPGQLAPVNDVLLAMTQGVRVSEPTSLLASVSASQPTVSIPVSTVHPDDPLTSPPSPKSSALPPARVRTLVLVLGSVLFLALFLAFVMSPCITRRLGAYVKSRTKARFIKRQQEEKREMMEKEAANGLNASSSVPSISLTTPSESKQSIIDSVKGIRSVTPDPRETVIDLGEPISQSSLKFTHQPSSAFTETEYSMYSEPSGLQSRPSCRISCATSDLPSDSSTIKTVPRKDAPITPSSTVESSPIRPPRPPTADSPTLSDSIYLAAAAACSDGDQPYIFLAPQSFCDTDKPVPPTPHSDSKTTVPASSTTHDTNQQQPNTGNVASSRSSTESKHQRARSAPSISTSTPLPLVVPKQEKERFSVTSRTAKRKLLRISRANAAAVLRDIENSKEIPQADVQDVQESFVRRVMKHRRSRSASGWAYPKKTVGMGIFGIGRN